MSLYRTANFFQGLLDKTQAVDFLAPLALRLYLAPIFWMAANKKWNPFDSDSSLQSTIDWFGNAEWGLGLPFPEMMAYLAWGAEYFGAILLVLGLAVRWISIPLMITMVVAAVTVHWQNGWLAISDSAGEQVSAARSLLKEHGNYEWLTEQGNFVILNNGIEFATTYFIMLLVLFFIGAGKYFSLDHWIAKKYRDKG
jgi:uncharacterized membrane protein YphA (DoxX/SURF4 family)